MNTQHIICPHCKQEVSLDDALTSQIRSSMEESLKLEMEKQHNNLTKEYEEKIKQEREKVLSQVKKDLEEESKQEMSFLKQELEEKKKKLNESQQKELELRKKETLLEEKQRTFELEIARKMDEERKIIREKTEHELVEAQRQKDMEKDKVINDLRKSLEDAQRKATQGSQQTQGEVQELALEELFRTSFPHDSIESVGKGVNGADIRQIVRSPNGSICGVILWESKQTKAWSEGWIGKLKTDLRAEKADISALVTSVYKLPNWNGIINHEGVWVCSYQFALALAMLLRKSLLDVGYQKAVSAHQGKKSDLIYEYVTGHEFRQQIESLVEVFSEMQGQILKEKVAFEKSWKVREGEVRRLFMATANIFGSVQGLAGSNAVPQVKGLEMLETGEDRSIETATPTLFSETV